ncbi:hypothetical protein FACS189435_1570 [Bacteroidia bacterium]|nr:hypothetical protein FACS189435_1570 [Bacteroidia bacterium]
MAKKKRPGHYCRICGCRKPNEKFSGKGHAKHICKEYYSLPQEKKNELQYINRIDRIAEKYPRSREDWEYLEKCARNTKYPEAAEFSQMILGMSGRDASQNGKKKKKAEEQYDETLAYGELDGDFRGGVEYYLENLISDFLVKSDYLPEGKHRQKILDMFCREVSREYEAKVVCDGELESLFDETLKNAVADFEADGIRFSSYMDSLVVMETKRLTIRKFISDDLPALHAIMGKPEVMYAWEHGFTRSEARKWLNRQLTRYRKDGYGYFAVMLKETGELAGQAGLMKNEIDGSEVVELGYIFDDRFWKQGYGLEAAKACVEYAFNGLGIGRLYCSVRPENTPSIRICEKLGTAQAGEHTVRYMDKDMPHVLYLLEKQ